MQELIKRESAIKHEKTVLNYLRRVMKASRKDIYEQVGLPRTTVYDALVRLQIQGLIKTEFEKRTSRGRPKTYYSMV